ncbi:glycosyltransferase family 39 protein, partial [Candidatus Woesearchaeota archaeon]|nr:glycosyltransferase family 39 protein [Candidatus Woesearchaeota archaeon]
MKLTKTAAMLGFIVLLALVLRIIAANYVNVSTDEMIYSILPLNIMSAGRLGTVEQSPLAFYLNDFSYMIFGGISPISIRLPGILFGAASVVLIFLLSLQLVKDKTAAYGAALLFTFSGYALINNVEMDMAAFFFALLSIYFFIRSLDDSWYLYLASVSLALG